MSYFGSSQFEQESLAKLTEVKTQQAKEIAQLKLQVRSLTEANAKPSTASAAPGPKSTAVVNTSKLETEISSLRKEVATMKKLFAKTEEDHRRQLDAVVLEGIEHEERYRQLAVSLDAKIVARDKKLAELRDGMQNGTPPLRVPFQAESVESEAAMRLKLVLTEVLRVAQQGLTGQQLKSEIGTKRSREDSSPTVAYSPLTVATTVATSLEHEVVAAKKKGRPTGKSIAVAPADAEARSKANIISIKEGLAASAALASVSTPAASKRIAFGADPISEYINLRKVSSRGVEESRLATSLADHFGGNLDRLGASFAEYITTRCGPVSVRAAAQSAVLSVIQGLIHIPGATDAFISAAWDRGKAAMLPEACHINHSGQLWALGYAIQAVIEESRNNTSMKAHAKANSPVLPALCVSDFMCSYLHTRNRERSQRETLYALPQLLWFLSGLLPAAERGSLRRSLPEMAAHIILHDVLLAGDRQEWEGAFQLLCDQAGWLRPSGSELEAPTMALRSMLAKLKLLTAARTSNAATDDAIQQLLIAIRPLLLYSGYSALGEVTDAFATTDATTNSAYLQLLATAVVDFNITAASPDWVTFLDIFNQFLKKDEHAPVGHLTVAHVFVYNAIVHCGVAADDQEDANVSEALASVKGRQLEATMGVTAALMASRMIKELTG